MVENQIPRHVAIIPDGNRRWAKEKGFEGVRGHKKSTEPENVKDLLTEAKNLGIEYISLWGFSTENWKRSAVEKRFLFSLVTDLIGKLRGFAHENKMRFRHVGRRDRLPGDLISALESFEEETRDYDSLNVQLCLDYGGRDEIVRALQKIAKENIDLSSEEEFLKYLDTNGIPEADLIIRTGGEKRLSGFMLYQSSYSELYFVDTYFPDFGPADLQEAVGEFSRRKRRFGGN